MRKGLMIILVLIICIVSVGAERRERIPNQEQIDFEGQGFVKMYSTAYCVGHHTANGSAVHEGGCASSIDRIGNVAIVYTLDGEFIGYLEVNDTGKEGGGVRAGEVLDVFKSDLDRCQEYMDFLYEHSGSGMVWVKFIEGDG